MCFVDGSGLVQTCTFNNNNAYNGGGLYVSNSGYKVDNCLFHTNTAGYRGGGIYLFRSAITGSVFTCNVATSSGGGVYSRKLGSIINCTIVSNVSVSGAGGGVCFEYGSTLSDCFISNNIAGGSGGGVSCYVTMINNCVIARNQSLSGGGAWGGGGGVWFRYNTIKNSIIEENTAGGDGGGIRTGKPYDYYNCVISGCTIVSNSVSAETGLGGGIYDVYTGGYTIYDNCVIYFNSASGTASNYYVSATAYVAFTNCCFSPALTSAVAVSYSTNNITANPQFVDRAAGNYHLKSSSPCVNTGANRSWMTGGFDLDGMIRIRYEIVDMGAYECIYRGTLYKFQ